MLLFRYFNARTPQIFGGMRRFGELWYFCSGMEVAEAWMPVASATLAATSF